MKKLFLFNILLFVAGLSYAQTNTENYVQSTSCLDDNCVKKIETIQYYDLLGRPKQVTNIKASPKGRDVVTPIEYDEFGRQVKDYLPIPQSGTLNGAIVPTPLANATQTDIYGQEKIYTEKKLDDSPLERILEQKQVGTAWNDKPVKFEYGTNTASEVKKYVAVTSYINGNISSSISSTTTNYGANQLDKTTVTDEDGNQTIEFKNSKGQVLLIRKIINATEKADTYYVYNEYEQLAFVIPPKASIVANVNTILNDLCYIYRYDERNRLIIKKLPGRGYEFMVYDKQNRLVMTQDAVMGASKQWLFTKYDQFGRIAYTGIYTSAQTAGTAGRAAEQTLIDTAGSNNVTRTASVGFTIGGREVYYDNSASTSYPNSITSLLSINYYDTYPVYGFNPTFPTSILGTSIITDNFIGNSISTKGLPVMSLVKNIEDNNWTSSYIYYDSKGRAIGSHSINHLGGYTKTETELDFAGTVKQTILRHKRLATDTERTIKEAFTYDNQNRLLTHTHQVDAGAIEYLTQNKFNELSQLESKKTGGTIATPLQQVDYKYNIRGWMTQINDPTALGSDLFGYKINYNQVEGLETPDALDATLKVKPKYNGNIAEVSWKTLAATNEPLRRYGYVYDPLNRLTAGFYQGSTPSAKEYFEKIEYDLNGNISRLKRSEGIPTGGTIAGVIDNLKYDYLGNRLIKITDEQQNPSGYPYNITPNEIGYDLNGNMTSQLDKGIQNINYNFLNLPNTIKVSTGGKLFKTTNYIYRADGTKLRKNYILGLSNSQTDYLDGFQYLLNDSGFGCVGCPLPAVELQFAPTSEGYYDFVKNKYIYNYTDHLGNVRVSYLKSTSGLEVIEENNYYPFGLKQEGYNNLVGNPSYQYKYNGKELQTETGMYDYGARFYMPDIGRWGVIDPLAEVLRRHTPYNYAVNNPITFVDPDGRLSQSFIDGMMSLGSGTNTGSGFGNGFGSTMGYDGEMVTITKSQSAFFSLSGGKETPFSHIDFSKFGNGDPTPKRKYLKKTSNAYFGAIESNDQYQLDNANWTDEYQGTMELLGNMKEYFDSAANKLGGAGYSSLVIDNLKTIKDIYGKFKNFNPGLASATSAIMGVVGTSISMEGNRLDQIMNVYKNANYRYDQLHKKNTILDKGVTVNVNVVIGTNGGGYTYISIYDISTHRYLSGAQIVHRN